MSLESLTGLEFHRHTGTQGIPQANVISVNGTWRVPFSQINSAYTFGSTTPQSDGDLW